MDTKLLFLTNHNKNLEDECSTFINNSKSAFFQQTLEWRNVLESIGSDKSVYVIAKQGRRIVGLLPLYNFKSPHGNIINSVPYPGPLGGILIEKNCRQKDNIFELLIKGLDKVAKKNRCVLATIISSPFEKDRELYLKHFKPDWELENYTLYIDFTKPPTTTSHFRNNLKRMLKRAEREGFTIEETRDGANFEAWYKVHSLRHREIGIDPLPKKILSGILTELAPAGKAKFFVVKKRKNIIAGCFLAYHKDILDTYIISGDNDSYKNGAIYLLVNHLLRWAKENNFKIFNWQSSKPKGGGPYSFKMQWGSRESPYFFFTKKYGSVDKIARLGASGVKEKYKWHFVLPYSVLENSNKVG